MTGIGILVSAYGALPGEHGISSYHWRIAVYLAWFANLTHLSTLAFLRGHLHRNPTERNWRVASMFVMFLLLLVAQFPTAFFNWSDNLSIAKPSSFARCFFDLKTVQGRSPSHLWAEISSTNACMGTALSMIMLLSTLFTRIVKVSKMLSSFVRFHFRERLSSIAKRCIRALAVPRQGPRTLSPTVQSILFVKPAMSLFLVVRLYLDLYSSMMSEVSETFSKITRYPSVPGLTCFKSQVYWLWISAAWGSIHIFLARNSAKVDESSISFGQILSIILLILPVIPIFATLYPIKRDVWQALRSAEQTQAAEQGTDAPFLALLLDLDHANILKMNRFPLQPKKFNLTMFLRERSRIWMGMSARKLHG